MSSNPSAPISLSVRCMSRRPPAPRELSVRRIPHNASTQRVAPAMAATPVCSRSSYAAVSSTRAGSIVREAIQMFAGISGRNHARDR